MAFADGTPFFQDFGDSLWQMYVAWTTANFPDIMQPAYNYNGFYVIIFFSYMIMNFYLFGDMLLSSVAENFQINLKVTKF